MKLKYGKKSSFFDIALYCIIKIQPNNIVIRRSLQLRRGQNIAHEIVKL